MPPSILQRIVVAAAHVPAGGTLQITHGMRHYNHPLKPTVIMPTTATPIVVQSADDTNIVFENPTAAALSAAFLVQYDHTIQQAAYGGVPIEFYWAGLGAAGSGLGPTPIWIGGRQSWNSDVTPLLAGAISFDADLYPGRSFSFLVTAANGNAGITAHLPPLQRDRFNGRGDTRFHLASAGGAGGRDRFPVWRQDLRVRGLPRSAPRTRRFDRTLLSVHTGVIVAKPGPTGTEILKGK